MELVEAIKKAKNVYLVGNGGSAANCNHVANDLLAAGIKAHALVDVATLTAIGNDYGYEHVFSRQVEVFGEPGDLLIALSGSGNSPNILKAIITANARGMSTFAVVGDFGRSAAKALADSHIASGTDMQDAENRQLVLFHRAYRELKEAHD